MAPVPECAVPAHVLSRQAPEHAHRARIPRAPAPARTAARACDARTLATPPAHMCTHVLICADHSPQLHILPTPFPSLSNQTYLHTCSWYPGAR